MNEHNEPFLHSGLTPEEKTRRAQLVQKVLGPYIETGLEINQALRDISEETERAIKISNGLKAALTIAKAGGLRNQKERIAKLAQGASPEGTVEQWIVRKRKRKTDTPTIDPDYNYNFT